MNYRIADPGSISPGPGPHPAASPYDKRISEALGLTAFEVYQVELPVRLNGQYVNEPARRITVTWSL